MDFGVERCEDFVPDLNVLDPMCMHTFKSKSEFLLNPKIGFIPTLISIRVFRCLDYQILICNPKCRKLMVGFNSWARLM